VDEVSRIKVYPLFIVIVLIIYGSLYPWRFAPPMSSPLTSLLRSWPTQWHTYTAADAAINIVAYMPLGALVFLAAARRRSPRAAVGWAVLTGLLLSVCMEVLQVYIPGRTASLFDAACNAAGAAVGALAAWRASRFRGLEAAPAVLLGCWIAYHLYPFVPLLSMDRMRFELAIWLHLQSFSVVEAWGYAAEWVAVGAALQRIFGAVRPWWMLLALAFHFAARPIMVSMPLLPEEAAGALLAFLLWKALAEPLRCGPWLLISAILLRGWVPLRWPPAPPAFAWIPFQTLLASSRGMAIVPLFRTAFDYTGVLWLWRLRGMPYKRGGAILAAGLAVLALVQLNLPGRVLSMTDPALALLLATVFAQRDYAPTLERPAFSTP
jgi:VanZ family protein